MRLDACSPKDTPGGTTPITSTDEIWRRIACSRRAVAGIKEQRERDGVEKMVELFLFPWNAEMRTELEYRVFCPPPACEIVAVSQYRWLEPWHFKSKTRSEAARKAEEVLKGVREVHAQVVKIAREDRELMGRGFVFDVTEMDGGRRVALVELNRFGAETGCGSCLFQWIGDAEGLYGLKASEDGKVLFRVATDDDFPERSNQMD